MPKSLTGLKTRQFLNIMILLSSAMFLIFTLLSIKMQTPQENPASSQVKIVKIDFGEREIILRGDNWQAATTSEAKSDLQLEELNLIGNAWQTILDSAKNDAKTRKANVSLSGPTVLLYLDGNQAPIVTKLVTFQSTAAVFFPADNRIVSLTQLDISIEPGRLNLAAVVSELN